MKPAASGSPRSSPGRVLVVDDESMIREILCEKLRTEGYHCFSASSASEAVSRLSENAPDLILLDVMMPGKSGVEVLSELKSLDPHVSVIMVTAVQDIDTAIETMKIGADDYLLKPFKLTEVVVSVQKALEKRRFILSTLNYQIHLENEVAERTRELGTLNRISETLSRTLDLEAVLGAALGEVMDLTEIASGGIYLLDEEFGTLGLATAKGLAGRASDQLLCAPIGGGVIGRVAETGHEEVVEEGEPRPDPGEHSVLEKGIRSYAAIPLRSTERIVGVLAIGSPSYRRFSEREIELLKAIGVQAGMAIENAILYGKEKREAEISASLLEVSRVLSMSLDGDALMGRILRAVGELVRADSATIWIVDPSRGGCALRECLPDDPIYPPGSMQSFGSGIAGWSTVHGETFLIRRRESLGGPIPYMPEESRIASFISVPLSMNHKILGVLLVARLSGQPPFRQEDMGPLMLLAGEASVAMENARLFQEVKRQTQAVREANFDAIKALAETLETKDAYTRGHSDRAVRYAVAVGRRLGLSEEEIEWLKYAAIFHDIGKIGIPDSILNKPAKLTNDEYEIMKTHPQKGADIIKQIKFLVPVAPLVLYHQERYDGKGYPAGLKGDAIPIQSRIVAVLDAYDAMISDRIYRKAPGKEYAIRELKLNAGTQFDPRVIEVFLNMILEPDF